ncbi:MAG: glycyl-radical enzyme activating protein [Desulfobacter sp.]|nr:MAG: glycyl-radical enzyme activating protein [Desulfobacter sp.]
MAMGKLFAIKKYAIHDGPAIRTTVFFKGCPLSCAWCHNPEGMSPEVDLVWLKDRCAGCGQCLQECRAGALTLEQETIVRDRVRCTGCGHCADVCPALAHEVSGWEAEAAQVMDEVKKDMLFYDQSGGGVTFSGGDPLFQPEFLSELLRACGELGIHRTVDTCAHTTPAQIKDIAALTDLFLIDIKHMDTAAHKRFTGAGNGQILENIRLLAGMKKEIRFRIPLIEGVNSDAANIAETGAFIADAAPGSRVDLLPYHRLAGSKYAKLGMAMVHGEFSAQFNTPGQDRLKYCAQQLEGFGLKVTLGG